MEKVRWEARRAEADLAFGILKKRLDERQDVDIFQDEHRMRFEFEDMTIVFWAFPRPDGKAVDVEFPSEEREEGWAEAVMENEVRLAGG